MEIVPSILSTDFVNLQRDVRLVEQSNVDAIHIDVMDGQFVPNITFGWNMVTAIRSITQLSLDVHLMIVEPERYIEKFIEAGANTIGVHVEATKHIHRVIQMIKNKNVKAEVVLNPGTSIVAIEHVLSMVDQVLVMTVNPGFGGQVFIKEMAQKIQFLSELRDKKSYKFKIEVDGGIIPETAGICRKAGADVFVSGSYIYDSQQPIERIKLLKQAVS